MEIDNLPLITKVRSLEAQFDDAARKKQNILNLLQEGKIQQALAGSTITSAFTGSSFAFIADGQGTRVRATAWNSSGSDVPATTYISDGDLWSDIIPLDLNLDGHPGYSLQGLAAELQESMDIDDCFQSLLRLCENGNEIPKSDVLNIIKAYSSSQAPAGTLASMERYVSSLNDTLSVYDVTSLISQATSSAAESFENNTLALPSASGVYDSSGFMVGVIAGTVTAVTQLAALALASVSRIASAVLLVVSAISSFIQQMWQNKFRTDVTVTPKLVSLGNTYINVPLYTGTTVVKVSEVKGSHGYENNRVLYGAVLHAAFPGFDMYVWRNDGKVGVPYSEELPLNIACYGNCSCDVLTTLGIKDGILFNSFHLYGGMMASPVPFLQSVHFLSSEDSGVDVLPCSTPAAYDTTGFDNVLGSRCLGNAEVIDLVTNHPKLAVLYTIIGFASTLVGNNWVASNPGDGRSEFCYFTHSQHPGWSSMVGWRFLPKILCYTHWAIWKWMKDNPSAGYPSFSQQASILGSDFLDYAIEFWDWMLKNNDGLVVFGTGDSLEFSVLGANLDIQQGDEFYIPGWAYSNRDDHLGVITTTARLGIPNNMLGGSNSSLLYPVRSIPTQEGPDKVTSTLPIVTALLADYATPVNSYPVSYGLQLPTISKSELVAALVAGAVVIAATSVGIVVASKFIRKRSLRKGISAQRELLSAKKDYDDGLISWDEYYKKQRAYSRKAAFHGWATYDASNGWFNTPGDASNVVSTSTQDIVEGVLDKTEDLKQQSTTEANSLAGKIDSVVVSWPIRFKV